MTWIEVAKTHHECKTPNAYLAKRKGYTAGSVWRCDECGQQWQLWFGYDVDYFLRYGEEVLVDARVKADIDEPVSETDPKCDHLDTRLRDDHRPFAEFDDFAYCPKCGEKL